MEWRCEWCGKPHAEDNPPCDNCGHGSFERAVVPSAPEGDGEGGPLVWVCADCGREHPRNNPPCSRCGGGPLEKQRQSFDEDDPLPDDDEDGEDPLEAMWSDDDDEPVAGETTTVWACEDCGRAHPRNNPPCSRCGGMTLRREEREFDEDDGWDEPDRSVDPEPVGSDTMTSWICTECGRPHPRNNPPCSRCGAMSLEQREQRFDDAETAGGWRGALDWKVALGFVGAAVLAVLLVGPAIGYFDLPGQGPPAVEDVPGESDTVGGVPLAEVERAFVDRLGDARVDDGAGDLSWNRELGLVATFDNRWRVKRAYTDANGPSDEELRRAVSSVDSCDADAITLDHHRTGTTVDGTPADGFGSADEMAAGLVDVHLAGTDGYVRAASGSAGVDVHVAPDGRVYVTVFYC